MSLYERVPDLSLRPRVNRPQLPAGIHSPVQLIRWILWDPLALEVHLSPVSSAVGRSAQQNQQQSLSDFLQRVTTNTTLRTYFIHLALAFIFVFVVIGGLMGVGIAIGLLPSLSIPPLTLFGALLVYGAVGFLLAFLLSLIGLWTNHLPLTTVWAFCFGVGIPTLLFQQFWLQMVPEAGSARLLFAFTFSYSLLVGVLLNYIRGFMQRCLHEENGQELSQYLQIILLLFYLLITTICFSHYGSTIGTGEAISTLVFSLAVTVAAFVRIDDYLLARLRLPAAKQLFTMKSANEINKFARLIPRASYLAPPQLTELLHHWLDVDERRGFANAHELWCHTNLHAMVIACVRAHLADQKNNDQLLGSVIQIVDPKHGWEPEDFLGTEGRFARPIGLTKLRRLVAEAEQRQHTQPNEQRRQQRYTYRLGSARAVNYGESDAAWRAAMAGFLYLKSKEAAKAAKAFARLPDSALARELALLSRAFAQLLQEENLALAKPPIVTPPPPPHRRPDSWRALQIFAHIHHGAWLYQRCVEFERQATLQDEIHRDFRQLHSLQIPKSEAEEEIIVHLENCWHGELLDWFHSGQQPRPEEVESPFIFAKPLSGEKVFVGRQQQLQQLQQCNSIGNSRPVLLHGAPKVGKTSLLNRFAKLADQTVTLIPVYSESMLRGGKIDQQLTIASCQAIARTVTGQVLAASDLEEKLGRDPLHFLQSYITRICTRTEERMFVLVLDNFIELLHPQQPSGNGIFASPVYVEQFLQMLHELLNSLQNFNVIFVTRKQPTSFLQQPPWQLDLQLDGIEQIFVGNLTPDETRRLLQHPTADFPLRCAGDAVKRIYQRTEGRPFLVQLLGSQLVQHYNQSIREQKPVAPFFLARDFDQIERREEFVQQSNWYFNL